MSAELVRPTGRNAGLGKLRSASMYVSRMRIERVVDVDTLERGSKLFDDPPLPVASSQFLESGVSISVP
jgi:hypothetical protein